MMIATDQCAFLMATAIRSMTSVATGPLVKLIASPFTPSPTLTLDQVTLASFSGSAAKTITTGSLPIIKSPETSGWGMLLAEPIGGLKWICANAPDPAETIYGYIVTDPSETYILFSALLDVEKQIAAAGDFVEISAVVGYLPYTGFEA